MLTLIVFGSIQACNMIYLKHGLVTAAYEGTLELAKRNATNSSVIARTQQVLDARGVVSSSITLLPSGVNVSTATPGDAVTIQVSAQVSPNMSLTGFLPMPTTLTGRIVATR